MKRFNFKKIHLFILSIISLLATLFQVFMSNEVNKIIDMVKSQDNITILYHVIIAILSIAIYQIFSVIKSRYANKLIRKQIKLLKRELFSSFYNSSPSTKSKYVSIFCNDINLIEDKYYMSTLKIVESISIIIIVFIALSYINVFIALAVLLILIFNMLIGALGQKSINEKIQSLSTSYEKEMDILDNYFEGYITIKSLKLEELAIDKYNNKCNELEDNKYNFSVKIDTTNNIFEGFSFFNIIIITFISSFFIQQELITLGSLISITIYANILFSIFPLLIMSIIELISSKSIFIKVIDLINTEHIHLTSKEFKTLTIEHLNISLDNKNIIKDFNYIFNKGDKICIIGDNGTGKTTLINSICKLVNYDGKILYNNSDINTIDIFNDIKYIPQKPFLFSESIEFNILLGNKNIDKDYLKYVLDNLGLTEIYFKRKNETIGNDKINISGGEKQKISIARMLLQNPKVLIMDESLSMVDEKGRKTITEFLLKQKFTLIHITHNKELINMYDKIINFNNI